MPNGAYRGVRSYNQAKAITLPMGATAALPGDILKLASGVLDPAADNDKQGQFFVALQEAAANADGCLVVPLADCVLETEYDTATTPSVGVAYGISSQRELDASDTTNLLLTVISVNTTRNTVKCIEYQVSG